MYFLDLNSYLLRKEDTLAVFRTPWKFCVSHDKTGKKQRSQEKKKKRNTLYKLLIQINISVEI